jgi:hypothetical protein
MNFTAKGRKYAIDKFGVITQQDHRPFVYDPNYSAIYDSEQYKRGSDLLQALRAGFACASHGRPINSLMDVGYGNAAFINFIKKKTIETVMSTKCGYLTSIDESGLVPYVYGHDITGVPLDGAYLMPEFVKADVYTFWDVLEHFPDCSFLKDLPTETICISLPYCHFHTEGLDWFENKYHHLKPDEHIRHFNPWSLTAFMNQYGWKAVAESGHEDIVRKGNSGLQNILSMGFKR